MPSDLAGVALDNKIKGDVKTNKKGVAKDKRDRVVFDAQHDGMPAPSARAPLQHYGTIWAEPDSSLNYTGKHGQAKRNAHDEIDA